MKRPPPFHVLNRCNLPPWAIASQAFQSQPEPIEIEGVRRTDRRLFDELERIQDPSRRGEVFHDYLSVKFGLHQWADHKGVARSSLRHTYLSFILAWQADSNGHAGAVLKSWVESRFGLPPTYHCGLLARDPEAREAYARDRMKGAARTVGAFMQLDLLYTYCQGELARRQPGKNGLVLFRGTHDPEEYSVESCGAEALVRLNNLSSFTSDPEIAWEFGSSVWKVRVPLPKIVFFSGLLPPHILGGESEYLVLGGDYRVASVRA